MPSPWREDVSVKAADQTIDDTVLVSLGVSIGMAAGRKYQVWGTILLNSPAADDFKCAFVTTGTITGRAVIQWGGSVFSVPLDGTATGLIPQGGAEQLLSFHGFAKCTADGTLTVHGAKFADAAGTTTTIYKDGTVLHVKVMA